MFIILGTDVSKKTLDSHLLRADDEEKGLKKSVPNTPPGFASLLEWVHKKTGAEPTQIHVVMEATGPYHEAFAQALFDAGCPVAVANPARVKHFARSEGICTKNDQVDARVLACYRRKSPTLRRWQPTAAEYRQLTALIKRREALECDLQRERNRYEKITVNDPDPQVLESFQRLEDFLTAEIEQLTQCIEQYMARHAVLQDDYQLLQSIPGVGPVVALIMVALLQHGERFDSAPQAAAYLGLIPVEVRSGSSVHAPARLSKVGPAQWRAKLYMPAVSATQCNPDIKALYQRLIAHGKPPMVAVGAAMRKLVHICFGVIKHQSAYKSQIPA